jgi:hypothetical protein
MTTLYCTSYLRISRAPSPSPASHGCKLISGLFLRIEIMRAVMSDFPDVAVTVAEFFLFLTSDRNAV